MGERNFPLNPCWYRQFLAQTHVSIAFYTECVCQQETLHKIAYANPDFLYDLCPGTHRNLGSHLQENVAGSEKAVRVLAGAHKTPLTSIGKVGALVPTPKKQHPQVRLSVPQKTP